MPSLPTDNVSERGADTFLTPAECKPCRNHVHGRIIYVFGRMKLDIHNLVVTTDEHEFGHLVEAESVFFLADGSVYDYRKVQTPPGGATSERVDTGCIAQQQNQEILGTDHEGEAEDFTTDAIISPRCRRAG